MRVSTPVLVVVDVCFCLFVWLFVCLLFRRLVLQDSGLAVQYATVRTPSRRSPASSRRSPGASPRSPSGSRPGSGQSWRTPSPRSRRSSDRPEEEGGRKLFIKGIPFNVRFTAQGFVIGVCGAILWRVGLS